MTGSTRLSTVCPALLAALLLAAGVGCAGAGRPAATLVAAPAGGAGATAAQPAVLPNLPAPSHVQPRKTSTLIDFLNGADFDAMTVQGVSPQGMLGQFAPAWSPASGTATGLAFGLYRFVPDLANDPPLLHLAWQNTPPAGTVWVGLANFPADRWDWQPWQSGHDIPLDFGAKNVNNQGEVRAVVLLTGAGGPYSLVHLRVGANQPPTVSLSVEHPNQAAPFALTIHADNSSDPDGVIVSYDFDFNNDGTYDQTGVTVPQAMTNITTDGSFKCKVRVTDDDGAQAEGTIDWDTGTHQQWAAFSDYGSAEFYAVCAIPSGGYYAAGSTITASGGVYHALLVKFNADSTVAWARSFSSTNQDEGMTLALAPDGGTYIAGSYNYHPGSQDAFVARYAPDGSLDWQRSWGGGKDEDDYALVADNANDQVYLATTLNQDVTGDDAALLKLDSAGTWAWTRMWGALDSQASRGLALAPDGTLLLGCLNVSGTDYDGALLRLDAQGHQVAKLGYSQGTDFFQPAGVCVRDDGVVAVFGTVGTPNTHDTAPYCFTLDSTLTERWSVQYDRHNNLVADGFADGVFVPGGKLWLCGYLLDSQSDYGGGLAWIADNGLAEQLWISGPDGASNALPGLASCTDGSLLLAGYVAQAGDVSFTDTQRGAGGMSLSFASPVQDIYADFTAPLVATGSSAVIQPLAAPDSGAIVYKYYPPLP